MSSWLRRFSAHAIPLYAGVQTEVTFEHHVLPEHMESNSVNIAVAAKRAYRQTLMQAPRSAEVQLEVAIGVARECPPCLGLGVIVDWVETDVTLRDAQMIARSTVRTGPCHRCNGSGILRGGRG